MHPTRRQFLASLAAAPLLARLGSIRPASSPRRKDHIVVVGAGAFGGWTALALLRAGHRVTLLDAWGAGHARASSGGETRVIRAVYNGEPAYTRMVHRALELWRDADELAAGDTVGSRCLEGAQYWKVMVRPNVRGWLVR